MEVELLLSCGDIVIVPIESVLLLPKAGQKIVCAKCKTEMEIVKVGVPYRVERVGFQSDESQKSLFGE